jgi:CheY-like chemotaxis protein
VGRRRGTTIVLADDHWVVRSGLRLFLEEAGCEVVAQARDVPETFRKVRASSHAYSPRTKNTLHATNTNMRARRNAVDT